MRCGRTRLIKLNLRITQIPNPFCHGPSLLESLVILPPRLAARLSLHASSLILPPRLASPLNCPPRLTPHLAATPRRLPHRAGSLIKHQLFVDRLIEWPQYCNHILWISHLRASHPDLFAFIARALNRISVAHGESDVFNNATSDTHQCLIQSSASNLEGKIVKCLTARFFVPHCHY
ncbi:hypothetical protein ACS0TY_012679 [Phlomoides rotata]